MLVKERKSQWGFASEEKEMAERKDGKEPGERSKGRKKSERRAGGRLADVLQWDRPSGIKLEVPLRD